MAMNIPLPPANFGGGLLQALMGAKEAQQNKQRMQQQQSQFLQDLGLRQQQQDRLSQLLPYQIGQYEQQSALFPLEQQYKQAQIQNLLSQFNPENQKLNTDLLRAKIESERAKASMLEGGGHQRITAAIQEADALFGDREDPRWKQYVANKNRVYLPQEQQLRENEELKSSPEYAQMEPYLRDAIDISHMPVGSQNMYRKEMNEELKQIDKAKQVGHAISKAREVTRMNPGMYKKAINIIANPEATPGHIEKSLTALLPEKDVAAFMTLHKLYSDILTKQAQLNNMSRSVYALRLQQQAKPQVKNPDEVNEQIFRNIEREIKPQIDREKPLLYALKNNKYLPFTRNYEDIQENQLPMEAHSPTAIGMMKGIDPQGNEVDVHPSRKEQFEKAGGRIL